MNVKVKFFASVRDIVGKREEELKVKEGATVGSLLETLSERYGLKFRDYVYEDGTRKLRDYLQFLLDGRSVTALGGMDAKLHEGAEFAIIPPVGGGMLPPIC